jgi:hypothetical protein
MCAGIAPTTEHNIAFEMCIGPLKGFFGRADCHGLLLKCIGFGDDEPEAWCGFEYACNAVADSLKRDRAT